jgi:hypothetical protein
MRAEQWGVAGAEWRRAQACVGEGHCVELSVAEDGAHVRMRNSTTPDTVLIFDADEWLHFLGAVKNGELPLTH